MSGADGSGLGDYVIKVRSHLDDRKRYWFEGLAMTTSYDEDGRPITILTGHLADQAALHGVLATIRDMNLPLISVRRVTRSQVDDLQAKHEFDQVTRKGSRRDHD